MFGDQKMGGDEPEMRSRFRRRRRRVKGRQRREGKGKVMVVKKKKQSTARRRSSVRQKGKELTMGELQRSKRWQKLSKPGQDNVEQREAGSTGKGRGDNGQTNRQAVALLQEGGRRYCDACCSAT